MIDWEKIQSVYPKAHGAWCAYLATNGYNYVEDEPKFVDFVGHLLAFFDERGLVVNTPNAAMDRFFANITFNDMGDCWIDKIEDSHWNQAHKTRNAALAAAFTQAFKILEGRNE